LCWPDLEEPASSFAPGTQAPDIDTLSQGECNYLTMLRATMYDVHEQTKMSE
jgi:hypothetical protein